MTNAVIYVRLSRYKGEEKDPSTSPQRQREQCVAHCEGQGWNVVEVIDMDLDVSGFIHGKRLERPGIMRMIELLPAVDKVVFLKLDRLARSVSDFHHLVELTAAHGVGLVSVKDGFDLGTATGRMMATMIAAFAEMESSIISERVTDARAYLHKVGRYSGGEVPYGYQVAPNPEGKGKVLVIEPSAAADIRQGADEVLTKDKSFYSIAVRWNRARTDGKRWTSDGVKLVLMGDAVSGRQAWPAVLDSETVLRLRVKFPKKAAQKSHRYKASRLLSGLLRCATCNGKMNVGTGGTSGLVGYTCRNEGCTKMISVNADHAEHLIEEWFLAEHGDDATSMRAYESSVGDGEAMIHVGIVDTTDAMAEGGDLAVLVPRLQKLRADLEELKAAPVTLNEHVQPGPPIRVLWAEGDLDERRAMLADELEPIVVKPGRRGVRVSLDRLALVEKKASEPRFFDWYVRGT